MEMAKLSLFIGVICETIPWPDTGSTWQRLQDNNTVFLLYAFCSAAAVAVFSVPLPPPQKNLKKDRSFVGFYSGANGEFNLHKVKALHPMLS